MLCCVELRKCLLEKCCWKTAAALKLRLFPHSFSPRHTPYDNEKKKNPLGWSEELNHGKDMCCCLILLKTEEEDLWQRRRAVSTEICFIAFLSERWVWLFFCSWINFLVCLSVVTRHYCSFLLTTFSWQNAPFILLYHQFCTLGDLLYCFLLSLVAKRIRFSLSVIEPRSFHSSRETWVSCHVYLFICLWSALHILSGLVNVGHLLYARG